MVNNEDAFAQIWFVPICSKCRKPIESSVNFKEEVLDYLMLPQYEEKRANFAMLDRHPVITPGQCPHCNLFFDAICIPKSRKIGPFEIELTDLTT